MDSRDGARQGLPWDAAQELLFLVELSIAKRALRAAELTGLPFNQMYAQCIANAEKARQSSGAATAAFSTADPWSDPRAHKEVGRRTENRTRSKATSSNGGAQKTTNWWRRLIG